MAGKSHEGLFCCFVLQKLWCPMKYLAYSKYKDSGVQWLGEVPEHWEVKRLKFFFPRLYSGVSVNSDSVEADSTSIGIMKTSCVYGNRFNPDENKRVVDHEIDRVACPVTGNSLIISRMNTPKLVGNCGYVETDYSNLFLPDRLWIARFVQQKAIIGKFAWYLVSSDPFVELTGALATGTSGSMKNLSQDSFFNIEAFLPPYKEQTAIADFLDRETGRIDTLEVKKRRLLELLEEKRTALISRTVTRGLPVDVAREFGIEPHSRFKDSGIDWLCEMPEEWKISPLKRVCDVRDGTHDTPKFEIPAKDTFPLVTSKDIVTGKIAFDGAKHICKTDFESISKRSGVTKGDILMPMIGTIGGAVLVDIEIQFAIKNIALFKETKHFYSKWLFYVLNSDLSIIQFDLEKSGCVQGFVALGTLRNLSFPFPPLPEQTAIATYLDQETAKIDQLKQKIQEAIARLQEYRTALITAAVTGKIDVRHQAA